MNLLDLMIKIAVDDRASGEIDSIANEATGKFSGMASKIGGAAKAIGTTVVAVTGAAVAGATAVGKAALDGYTQYEQLAGGITKLFGDADEAVMAHAQEAYRTSGMSANQYMEQVSGFAAALTDSLGGDTVKAAAQADVAMRAISDNVNTFGTDMESVQYAFQGFAKQNYTMLDNLKLGYGGTKSEMERLIADANEYAASIGQASDLSIDSFSDIVTAIDLVQEKQGIAGTTAREAATTIEGSVNMAKAAWSNWVTELGKDDADMQARTQELVDSLVTAAENIVPRISTIAGTLIETLPTAISELGTTLLPAVMEIGGSLLTAIGGILEELVTNVLPNAFAQIGEWFSGIDISAAIEELQSKIGEGIARISDWLTHGTKDILNVSDFVFQKVGEVTSLIMENVPTIVDSIGYILKAIGETLLSSAPEFLRQAGDFLANFINAIGENAPKWMESFANAVKGLIDLVIENGPEILSAAADFFGKILQALIENAPKILEALLSTLMDLIGYVLTHIPEILGAAVEFFGQILGALLDAIPQILESLGGLVLDAIDAIAGAVGDMLNAGIEFLGGLLDGVVQKGEEILDWFANLPQNLLNALGDLGSLLWDAGASILNGLWDGMVSIWNDLTGWVGGLADQIASLKGPLPYDKVVLVENGKTLMEGLGGGMRKTFEGEVLPYVKNMASEISDAMEPEVPTMGFDANGAGRFATASYAQKGVSITIERMEVRNDQDIYRLSEELSNLMRREEDATLWRL